MNDSLDDLEYPAILDNTTSNLTELYNDFYEFFDAYENIMKTSETCITISFIGNVFSFVSFVPLLLTYIIFMKWRKQEHNQVLFHFVLAMLLHNAMFLHYWIDDETFFGTFLQRVERYAEFLICEWMFLLVLCMRKMLIQVIITKNMYPIYVYALVYIIPLLAFVFKEKHRNLAFCVYAVVIMCVNTIMYCQIILSVVTSTTRRCSARQRNIVEIVIRFVILYTLVSILTIFTLIKTITSQSFEKNTDKEPDTLEEFKKVIQIYKVMLYSVSLSRIPTSVCIMYCLFGNTKTREMWMKYLKLKFR